MRTAGLMMNDVWAHRVLRERGVETRHLEDVEADIVVLVDQIDLAHRSPAENFRPYLHLAGELRSVVPQAELPYGIEAVTYSAGNGERVDAYYEFSDQQLVDLAAKGYFSGRFALPEQLTDIEWELPARVDLLVLEPDLGDPEASPVVFTQVHGIRSLDIDLESSGYDVTEYIADFSQEREVEAEAVIDGRGLPSRSDGINPLFSETELEALAKDAPAARPVDPEVAEAGLGSQLQRIEEELEAEAEQYRLELARTEGTPEKLYHERVAEALREAEQEEHEATADSAADRPEPSSAGGHEIGFDAAGVEEKESERRRRAAQTTPALRDLDFGSEDPEQGLG